MHAVGLKDRLFLMPSHAFIDPNDTGKCVPHGTNIRIERQGKVFNYPFNRSLLKTDVSNDLAIYQVDDRSFPAFPNITKQFVTEHELSSIKHSPARRQCGNSAEYSPVLRCHEIGYSCHGVGFRPEIVFSYSTDLSRGDCGVPTVLMGNTAPGKVLGIHVAGSVTKVDNEKHQGILTVVTKESIEEALSDVEVKQQNQNLEFVAEGEILPNVETWEELDVLDRIHTPSKTKIKSSVLADHLPWQPRKFPAILHDHDVRNFGSKPLELALERTGSSVFPKVDESLVESIGETMKNRYNSVLYFPFGKRQLTFVEALEGIPGRLSSVDTSTSPGYPLMKLARQKGKRDFVWFDHQGKLCYENWFRDRVLEIYRNLQKPGYAEESDFHWCGYLKDETLAPRKIFDEVKTRLIFCGDFAHFVAFRMYFGSIHAAFCAEETWSQSPPAIGMNPISADMELKFRYLKSEHDVGFLAGDYKNFDMRHHPIVRKKAYQILESLLPKEIVPENVAENFFKIQTQSKVRAGKHLVKFGSQHSSGCFYTTIVNCLVNEMYHRYCYSREAMERKLQGSFDENIRLITLGDDCVLSIKKSLDYRGPDIARRMEELGQTFTPEDKEATWTRDLKEFHEVSFLGSYPVQVEGQWCGALKKDILEETLMWTRDKDEGTLEKALECVTLSSLHSKEYFELFRAAVSQAFHYLHEDSNAQAVDMLPSQKELRRTVLVRTAASGAQFFHAEAEEEKPKKMWRWVDKLPRCFITETSVEEPIRDVDYRKYEAQSGFFQNPADLSTDTGDRSKLTTFQTSPTNDIRHVMTPDHGGKVISAERMNIDYGAEGVMFRETVTWSTAQTSGTTVLQFPTVPHSLLQSGDTDNVQNMPFDHFLYWRGDVEFTIQTNAMPFQAGALICFFRPLDDGATQVSLESASSMDNVIIQANQNTTARLTYNFLHPRGALNTFAMETDIAESLGSFAIKVLSPLASVDPSTVDVTVYTRFPNSGFSIARPVTTQSKRRKAQKWIRGLPMQELRELKEDLDSQVLYEAQGQGGSRVSNTNIYNVGDVAGNMPIENSNRGTSTNKNDQTVDADADVSVPIPMDNPPLVGGSIPTHQQIPGLSRAHGVVPVAGLSLHPERMCRKGQEYNPEDMKFDTILAKENLFSRVTWNSTDTAGTILFERPMNSFLGASYGDAIPPNMAILNTFRFFRCDIKLTLKAVKTPFHSGRLRITAAYGAPSLPTSALNVYPSTIIDFQKGQDEGSMLIPYNAQTESLITYEGSGVDDPIQDYSMGLLAISVLNVLTYTDTVKPAVDVLIYVSFHNPRLSVPRVIPFFDYTDPYAYPYNFGQKIDYEVPLKYEPQGSEGEDVIVYFTFRASIGKIKMALSAVSDTKYKDSLMNVLDAIRQHFKAYGGSNFQIYPKQEESNSKFIMEQRSEFIKEMGKLTGERAKLRNERKWDESNKTSVVLDLLLLKLIHVICTDLGATFVDRGRLDPIVYEPQGNEDPAEVVPEQRMDTPEKPALVVATTVEKTPPPTRPCKVLTGEHFEFSPTSILEVMRRAVQVEGMWTTSAFSTAPGFTKQVNILDVRPRHFYASFFAGWHGSIIVVFVAGTNSTPIITTTWVPQNIKKVGVTVVNQHLVGEKAVFNSHGFDFECPGTLTTLGARELNAKHNSNDYQEVQIPFDSAFNFMQAITNSDLVTGENLGHLISNADNDANNTFKTFQRIGDDFTLIKWRPPAEIYYRPYTGAGTITEVDNLVSANWHMKVGQS